MTATRGMTFTADELFMLREALDRTIAIARPDERAALWRVRKRVSREWALALSDEGATNGSRV